MVVSDYIIILLYVLGMIGVGIIFSRRIKSAGDMFSASGQSPWWISGLSAFMTMFSAGTFVVWGGVAYVYGVVAVAINMCYGVAALLVGRYVAARWRRLGVSSAAEFLQLRFGPSIVQFYTWFQGIVGIFAIGGAIYALSKIICALIDVPDGLWFADPQTGMLSVPIASISLCIMVIIIACTGGLWAVLVTDVLQFIVLFVSVIFVVPLILVKAGGWIRFLETAPEGFLSPVSGDYTWWFLTGWIIVHYFKIGGEWGFVQRYTCVRSPDDARRAANLFGILYLVSPIFWMFPALMLRVITPDIDPEQAYVLACQLVLPAGMMGLMVAAMTSATASAATTQLNVFAGAFTSEIYQRQINPAASENQLVMAGRIFTVILGLVVMSGALLIPRYGYTRFVIDLTVLLTGPLVLPTIWGLFSRKINLATVWYTTLAGFSSAVIIKFGFAEDGFLSEIDTLYLINNWVVANQQLADLSVGILVPLAILTVVECTKKSFNFDFTSLLTIVKANQQIDKTSSPMTELSIQMVKATLVIISIVMITLSVMNPKDRATLLSFATILLFVSTLIHRVSQPRKGKIS